MTFSLNCSLEDNIPTGRYILNKDTGDHHQLRYSHPLGEYILKKANALTVKDSFIRFNLKSCSFRQSLLEQYKGQSGYSIVYKIVSGNEYDNEEQLIFCAITDKGEILPPEFTQKLLEVPPSDSSPIQLASPVKESVKESFEKQLKEYEVELNDNTNNYVNFEIEKFEAWSDDQVYTLQNEVISLRKEHEAMKRQLRKEKNAQIKLTLKEEETKFARQLRQKQQQLFQLQDECEEKVDEMTSRLRNLMKNKIEYSVLFKFRWGIKLN